MRRPALERFAEKIALTDTGCIVWTGGISTSGYGTIWVNGRNVLVHRWAYQHVFDRSIPDGLHLDHLCRVRSCVNPDHLEPVTCRENILRGEGSAAERAKRTHCPAGHPYSGPNLYVPPGTRERHCRKCAVARTRAYRLRRKQAA